MPAAAAQRSLPNNNTILSWTAPSRPYKRRSRDFYVTIISMATLFGVVLFLIEGIMPVLLIVAIVFLFYVMSTVKPGKIDYKISDSGISIAGKETPWERLGRFWFANRFGSNLLIIESASLPGRIEMVITPELKVKLKKEIAKFLVHEEAPPSFLDKAANWATTKLPES